MDRSFFYASAEISQGKGRRRFPSETNAKLKEMTMPKERFYMREQVAVWLEKRFPKIDWTETIKELPPVIWRRRWDVLAEKTGLPYSRKNIQNLDCQGEGPGNIELNDREVGNVKMSA